MQKLAIISIKGGVGKSTVSAGLAYALRDKGFKVGYLDVDISGASGHKAFFLKEPPELDVDTARKKLVPPLVDGIRCFFLASKFTEGAAIGWSSQDRVIETSTGEVVVDKGRREFIRQVLTDAVDWGELDWLLFDLPPSSAEEVWAFFDYIGELFGALIVTQPSEISVIGVRKTVDFLKQREIPILGLVGNMTGYICSKCGAVEYPLISPKHDLTRLAGEMKIPYLVSIPQSSKMKVLRLYFDDLAGMVVHAEPKKLKEEVLSPVAKLERRVIKKAMEVLGK